MLNPICSTSNPAPCQCLGRQQKIAKWLDPCTHIWETQKQLLAAGFVHISPSLAIAAIWGVTKVMKHLCLWFYLCNSAFQIKSKSYGTRNLVMRNAPEKGLLTFIYSDRKCVLMHLIYSPNVCKLAIWKLVVGNSSLPSHVTVPPAFREDGARARAEDWPPVLSTG